MMFYFPNKFSINKEQKIKQIGKIPIFMIQVPNFKQTKTSLKDLISQNIQTKPSLFSKSCGFGWIQQKTINSPNPINIIYDEFIYTDKLTKKKIRMRDAKTSYEKRRHIRNSSNLQVSNISPNNQKKRRQSRNTRHNSNFQLQKQLTDLNDCYLMLKSTQMFKLNSLRQKIFESVDRSTKNSSRKIVNNTKTPNQKQRVSEQISNLLIKKKKIRQILQDSVKEANIKQFRKYFSNQNHQINHKIVSMNRHLPKTFNKSKIQKIISTINSTSIQPAQCKFIQKQSEDVEFPGQQKFKTQLIDYMKKQIKQNGQYLVSPEKKNFLYKRLYNNASLKSGRKAENNVFEQFAENNHKSNQLKKDTYQSTPISSRVQIDIDEESNSDIFLPQDLNLQRKSPVQPQPSIKKLNLTCKQPRQRHQKQNTCINFNKQTKNPSKISSFLNNFQFSPCQKNTQISMIKSKFQRNKKLSTKKLNFKEQRFLFMVENGLLFDVQKEILMQQDYLFVKDNNQDNLLHLCAKNHGSDMFVFIIERFRKCSLKKQMIEKWGKNILKDRLLEKNKNNKNVLQVAKLYQAEQIVQTLLKLGNQLSIRQFSL